MPWLRLEEAFYDHPKVDAAGNGPVGLWVRCACWSSAKGWDGRVPARVARTLGSRREADALVRARLWVPTDDGFLIPDFLEYNPSKEDSDRRRQIDAERKRQARLNVDRDGVNGRFVERGQP
jgi:hypothetical protein